MASLPACLEKHARDATDDGNSNALTLVRALMGLHGALDADEATFNASLAKAEERFPDCDPGLTIEVSMPTSSDLFGGREPASYDRYRPHPMLAQDGAAPVRGIDVCLMVGCLARSGARQGLLLALCERVCRRTVEVAMRLGARQPGREEGEAVCDWLLARADEVAADASSRGSTTALAFAKNLKDRVAAARAEMAVAGSATLFAGGAPKPGTAAAASASASVPAPKPAQAPGVPRASKSRDIARIVELAGEDDVASLREVIADRLGADARGGLNRRFDASGSGPGDTPLAAAVRALRPRNLELLLGKGAAVAAEPCCREAWPLLELALRSLVAAGDDCEEEAGRATGVVLQLLAAGADARRRTGDGRLLEELLDRAAHGPVLAYWLRYATGVPVPAPDFLAARKRAGVPGLQSLHYSILGQRGAKLGLVDELDSFFLHNPVGEGPRAGKPLVVLMPGPPGHGKTMLAKAVAKALGGPAAAPDSRDEPEGFGEAECSRAAVRGAPAPARQRPALLFSQCR